MRWMRRGTVVYECGKDMIVPIEQVIPGLLITYKTQQKTTGPMGMRPMGMMTQMIRMRG
jgi:hypothetical protein